MNLFIYSDESGVFDNKHNDIFVFGGLILIDQASKEEASRKYAAAEKVIRESKNVGKNYELKAVNITNKEKGKLFRSVNNFYKFAVIIDQKSVLPRIYKSKKDKQRYLDYAYKIAVKRAFEELIKAKIIDPTKIERAYFYVDEHSTATNGRYELKESLEKEFKNGTYNYNYDKFFPPVFKSLKEVNVQFCNSKSVRLVRAADIVANRVYYLARTKQKEKLKAISKLHITYLP